MAAIPIHDNIVSGTGPTSPFKKPCLVNPVVNLLPINDQLWLTIDTRFWGRMDPQTLDTIHDVTLVEADTLNAHPACDPNVPGACYVEYGCGFPPFNAEACVSLLVTQDKGGLAVQNVSSIALPDRKLIQHSHSPALTATQFISKLESFRARQDVDNEKGDYKIW